MAETQPHPRPISDIRLDGGRLCIDFVNTIHDRFAADVEDYIATPERYLEWAKRSGAIAPDEAIGLSSFEGDPEPLLADIRALRDALYLLLSASADGAPLPADALHVQNSWLKRARQSEILSHSGMLEFHAERDDARAPLKRIALDLVDTLADARGKARAAPLRQSAELRLAVCRHQQEWKAPMVRDGNLRHHQQNGHASEQEQVAGCG